MEVTNPLVAKHKKIHKNKSGCKTPVDYLLYTSGRYTLSALGF